MRVVLDTNILVSALLVRLGRPAAIYRAWQDRYFTLLTCTEQLAELKATLHKPAIAARIKPYKAGRLVNELKELAGSYRRFSTGSVRSGQGRLSGDG
jgi:predicted nucleic acid-binding protein